MPGHWAFVAEMRLKRKRRLQALPFEVRLVWQRLEPSLTPVNDAGSEFRLNSNSPTGAHQKSPP